MPPTYCLWQLERGTREWVDSILLRKQIIQYVQTCIDSSVLSIVEIGTTIRTILRDLIGALTTQPAHLHAQWHT